MAAGEAPGLEVLTKNVMAFDGSCSKGRYMSARSSSVRPARRMSPTTPTISASLFPNRTRFPTAASLGKNSRSIEALMTTRRPAGTIAVIEEPARLERNGKRREITAGGRLPPDVGWPFAGRHPAIASLERHRPAITGQRHDDGGTDSGHAGYLSNGVECARVEVGPRLDFLVPVRRQLRIHRQDGFDRETRIDLEQIREASENQSRPNEQDGRDGDLGHHQRGCCAPGRAVEAGASGHREKRRGRVALHGEDRAEAEGDRGEHAHHDGEHENGGIDSDGVQTWNTDRPRNKRDERRHTPYTMTTPASPATVDSTITSATS